MAGAGVGEGAGGRVEDGIKSSDERSIARVGAGEVVVEIVDYEGPLAAGGQDVRLRKIGNEWVVIKRQTTWVS